MSSDLRVFNALIFAICLWLLYCVVSAIKARTRTTKLRGPGAKSWLFGVAKEVFEGDSGALYESWTQIYDPVFQVLGPMRERRTMLMDPKAISRCFFRTNTYVKPSFAKKFTEGLVRSKHKNYPGGNLMINISDW